eukprot:jgi/Tetstr1/464547/TSEL_009304.t1
MPSGWTSSAALSYDPSVNDPGSPPDLVGIWRGRISIIKYDSRAGFRSGELFGVVSPMGHQLWLTEDEDSSKNINTIDNKMLTTGGVSD